MMMTKLQSFDRTSADSCYYIRPEKYSDLLALKSGPLIARGAGLSYCNAAAGKDCLVVDMLLFNRVIRFDEAVGIINVEAGLRIGDLNNFAIARGWHLPVLPGYPLITTGGCIAFNVHGKSQYKIGLFGDWVEELVLFHPSHGEITCSTTQHADLFDLTIGGMGLTGIILSAKIRLKKFEGTRMRIEAVKVANVNEAVAMMKDKSPTFDYVYSWNDFNLTGHKFGRGILYLEKIEMGFSAIPSMKSFRNRLTLPKMMPALLNNLTIFWMCQFYYAMNLVKPTIIYKDLSRASFPIYGKEIYYHLFGKQGFREYQVIFSTDVWEAACDEIRRLIQDRKMGIALASLKVFSGSPHHLNFSGEGICLALDIPNNKKSNAFFEGLDKVAIKYKGIVNLSKDSRAGLRLVQAVFPGYDEFKKRLNAFDPNGLFYSDLRKRLEL